MRNSTFPLSNQVVPVSGTYNFSEEDAIASIQADWVGGAIILPGPGSGHDTPNNGDTYTIMDGQNTLDLKGKTVTIVGGGFQFLSGGTMVFETTLTSLTETTNGAIQKSCLQFVFDAFAKVWLVC